MASENQASTASPLKKASTFAPAPYTAYLLSYDAKNWSNGVTLLDGSIPVDRHCGDLERAYRTLDGAQDAAMEWALKQLQDHLRTYDPRLDTEEEVDTEFDAWGKSSSEQGDEWSYTVSKEDETLVVTVEKLLVDGSFDFNFSEERNKVLEAGAKLKGF